MELTLHVEVRSFWVAVCHIISGLLTVAFVQSEPQFSKDGQPGLVKVHLDGIEGSICAQGYDERDAVVICRSLNLPYTDARPLKEAYRTENGPVLLNRLECFGNETSLGQCPGVRWVESECPTNQLVKVFCSSGTEGQFRLMSGSSLSVGRVEYYHRGEWGTVRRSNYWDSDVVAVVLCRSLGFPHKMARVIFGFDDTFRHEPRKGWIEDIRCKGTEASLEDCTMDYFRKRYQLYNKNTYVSCEDLRLRGSSIHQHSGILEGYFEDQWRNVYSYDFNCVTASVACKTLNLPRFGAKVLRMYNPVAGSNHKTYLRAGGCDGSESKLTDCPLSRWVSKEAGVVVISCDGADKTDLQFRLTGGPSHSVGYLQAFYQGHWGHVCGRGADSAVASVACRTLRLSTSGGSVVPTNYIGLGGKILLYEAQCAGNETNLADCYFNPWGFGQCYAKEALAIYCGSLKNNFNLRLKDGATNHFGRVEIYAYGTWHRVCTRDEYNEEEARVVCRELQLPWSDAKRTSCFDKGSSNMWPQLFHCGGDEDSLYNCTTNQQIWLGSCRKVLQVICSNEEVDDSHCFRLADWAIAVIVISAVFIILVVACVVMKVRRCKKEADTIENTRPQVYVVGENEENFELNVPSPILDEPPPAYDSLPPAYDTVVKC